MKKIKLKETKIIKSFKKNSKVIFAYFLGMVISAGTVYAATSAAGVSFDPSGSGLGSDITNVQSAIDKVYADTVDYSSLKSKLDNYTYYKYSDSNQIAEFITTCGKTTLAYQGQPSEMLFKSEDVDDNSSGGILTANYEFADPSSDYDTSVINNILTYGIAYNTILSVTYSGDSIVHRFYAIAVMSISGGNIRIDFHNIHEIGDSRILTKNELESLNLDSISYNIDYVNKCRRQ